MLHVTNKALTLNVPLIKSIVAAVVFTFALQGTAVHGAPSAVIIRDKDVKKAEKVIAKLRRLEHAAASPSGFHEYKSIVKDLYPGLFIDISELSESDLKTDLTTAVFLYETSYTTRTASDSRAAECGRGLREVYLKLCHDMKDGDPTRFRWAKARLHTKWAEAVVRFHAGATDKETLAELSDMKAERKVDLLLAERAVTILKTLEGGLDGSRPSGGPGADRAVSGNSERSEALSEALSAVNSILASLPRSPLYTLLHNASCSYRDGLFWWGKISHLREKTISANSLAASDPLKVIGLEADKVNEITLANWTKAAGYTERAEKAIGSLKSTVAE